MPANGWDGDESLAVRPAERAKAGQQETATETPRSAGDAGGSTGFLRVWYELRLGFVALGAVLVFAGVRSAVKSAVTASHPNGRPSYLGWFLLAALVCFVLFLVSYAAERPDETARRLEKSARRNNTWNGVVDPLVQMGMYSNDPQLARTSMVYTAQRELQKLQQAQAMAQQAAAAQRLADRAGEEERMRMLARAMIDEMSARVEAQRSGQR
jgi:signal transduction histidine kinase